MPTTDTTREQLRSARGSTSLGTHLGLLSDITQDLASSLDLDQTLRHTANRVRQFLDAEASSLFLIEDDSLVCRACSGPIDITGLRLDIDHGIVGKTVRNKQPQMVRDAQADPDFAQEVDAATGFVTRSILSVPLRVQDEVLGVLQLINRARGDGLFEHRDMELLKALAASAGLAIHNARMATELVEQERICHELALARVIQSSLLPTPMPPPCCIAGLNIPAREVSGDFFDFMPLGEDRIAFNIADVAGKGMDAALLMAKASSLLRCLGKQMTRPDELLARVNDELCETATRGKFITVVTGIIDRRDGSVVFANAGHQPPMLHRSGNDFEEFFHSSPPLGVIPGLTYPVVELSLRDGALYLFTDGLTEAADATGRTVEVVGVQQLIQQYAALEKQARLQAIADAITAISPQQHDDITMLVLDSTKQNGVELG
jgi:sigma-B regulation protein RsbU (phosphoserine phosphatase)